MGLWPHHGHRLLPVSFFIPYIEIRTIVFPSKQRQAVFGHAPSIGMEEHSFLTNCLNIFSLFPFVASWVLITLYGDQPWLEGEFNSESSRRGKKPFRIFSLAAEVFTCGDMTLWVLCIELLILFPNVNFIKCFMFPMYMLPQASWRTTFLQLSIWSLVLQKRTIHVPVGKKAQNLNVLLFHPVMVPKGSYEKTSEWTTPAVWLHDSKLCHQKRKLHFFD